MQLLELSHMLDGATSPHLLLPGVAIPGRDCQDEGDDALVHMPGLGSHHFQAALDGCNAPNAFVQMEFLGWITLARALPGSVALFTWRFRAGV